MIGYLCGKIKSIDFERVIIDVGGVGYGVHLSVRDVANLKQDQTVELLISEAVREQSYDLYGFFNDSEQKIFEQLLKVSGVGPRIALALLSLGRVDELFSALSTENISYLIKAPGVGKKLAEKMVIELRDKVPKGVVGVGATMDKSLAVDTEAALHSLGFKSVDIVRMMENVDTNLPVEEQIKQALAR